MLYILGVAVAVFLLFPLMLFGWEGEVMWVVSWTLLPLFMGWRPRRFRKS